MNKVVKVDFNKRSTMIDELNELRQEFQRVSAQVGHLGDYGRKIQANIALYEKELRK
jgi:hypothetical protein